jgi:uncharacterized protein (TIGR03435 family)
MKQAAVPLLPAFCAIIFAVSNGTTRAQSQSPTGDPNDPKFALFVYDVVVFKPYAGKVEKKKSESEYMGATETPDGYVVANSALTAIIGQACRTEHMQLSGSPTWLNSERYNVEAKMSPEVMDALQKLSPADQKLARQHMLQTLAREYMKLSVHTESKQMQILELRVAKNGPKFKESAAISASAGSVRVSSHMATFSASTIAPLASHLSLWLGRPVFDATGLAGRYDFTLTFSSERLSNGSAPSDDSSPPDAPPSLLTAIQEQLGLKLVSAKGTMNVVVIDHIERPAMN